MTGVQTCALPISAISPELDTVAERPIIWMVGLISLNLESVTSRVGPLPESLIRCISSATRHSTSVNQEGLCRINESALSEVAIMMSYFDKPLALSKSPTETPILAPFRIFLQISLNSFTFSQASALSGSKCLFFLSCHSFCR